MTKARAGAQMNLGELVLRSQSIHVLGFHLEEMSRIGQSRETESRSTVAYASRGNGE